MQLDKLNNIKNAAVNVRRISPTLWTKIPPAWLELSATRILRGIPFIFRLFCRMALLPLFSLPGWCRAVSSVRTQGKHAPRISQVLGATQHPFEGCCIPWAARLSGRPCVQAPQCALAASATKRPVGQGWHNAGWLPSRESTTSRRKGENLPLTLNPPTGRLEISGAGGRRAACPRFSRHAGPSA